MTERRYFKGACDIGFGPGYCFVEFVDDWAARQVEIYEYRCFSSLDTDESHGPNLSQEPLSNLDLSEGEEISAQEFETAWFQVTHENRS